MHAEYPYDNAVQQALKDEDWDVVAAHLLSRREELDATIVNHACNALGGRFLRARRLPWVELVSLASNAGPSEDAAYYEADAAGFRPGTIPAWLRPIWA